jgi:hypothetical protein
LSGEGVGVSDNGSKQAAFVFDPESKYRLVQKIRGDEVMPTVGLRYVAAVTGPWKIFKVVEFDEVSQLANLLEGDGDPDTATSILPAKVRKSHYGAHTALVMIDVDATVADPRELSGRLEAAIGSDEFDVVMGDFDILACVVDDDEGALTNKILAIRTIPGVERTVSLRVIDYVSTSDHAPDNHRVSRRD